MLVTVARYRELTGDAASLDAAVTSALTRAQGIIEAALDRALDYGTYTDEIPMLVYEWTPRAMPVVGLVDNLSVLNVGPERRSVIRGEVTAYGDLPGPFWGDAALDPIIFQYHGGYQTLAEVPPKMVMEWCNLARELIREDASREVRPPAWVSSLTNGDVAVTVRPDARADRVADMRVVLGGFRRE